MNAAAGERAMKGLGMFQAGVGAAALTVSRPVADLIGLRWDRLTGEAIFGWRLFAIRQILIGAGVFANVGPVRQANWLLQPADLLLFLHALRRGYIPRRASATTAGFALAALTVVAVDHYARAAQAQADGEAESR